MVCIPDTVGVKIINIGINVPLEKYPLRRPKINRKIKIDLREIAYDVDELAAVALKLCQFPQNW
jgi:hypothetical protein